MGCCWLPSPRYNILPGAGKKVTITGKMCHGLESWVPPKQTLREDSGESDSLGGIVRILGVP